METTREKARRFLSELKIKEALKECGKFDVTYSKEELRIIEIAYECYTGNSKFYKSLGINIHQNIKDAIDLMQRIK